MGPGSRTRAAGGGALDAAIGDAVTGLRAAGYSLITGGGLRDGRLHDARHTAAVLLLLGVPERAVMGIMGWSHTAMAARYQHVTSAG